MDRSAYIDYGRGYAIVYWTAVTLMLITSAAFLAAAAFLILTAVF